MRRITGNECGVHCTDRGACHPPNLKTAFNKALECTRTVSAQRHATRKNCDAGGPFVDLAVTHRRRAIIVANHDPWIRAIGLCWVRRRRNIALSDEAGELANIQLPDLFPGLEARVGVLQIQKIMRNASAMSAIVRVPPGQLCVSAVRRYLGLAADLTVLVFSLYC